MNDRIDKRSFNFPSRLRLDRRQAGLLTLAAFIASLGVCVSSLLFMTADQQKIAVPAFVAFNLFLGLVLLLWNRDGQLPVFDAGVFCALATLVYTVYPLLNYWISDLHFGPDSDSRLLYYQPSPAQLGAFHWRHVLYLFCLVLLYAAARGRSRLTAGNVRLPSRSTQFLILACFIVVNGYFLLLWLLVGVNFNYAYRDAVAAQSLIAELPLVVFQISLKLAQIGYLFKLALLLLVIQRCHRWGWRIFLCCWLAAEVGEAVLVLGSRTDIVLLLMAAIILYHRLVKPLTLRFVLLGGSLMFAGFILFGYLRLNVDRPVSGRELLTSNNEFQVLLGTAYDVYELQREGKLDVPWQVYINDVISILPPRQVLPFEKIAASEWYLQVIGKSGIGLGLMWGVVTQCVVGWDWVELALRGAVLGLVLGLIHRWYVRRSDSFLPTLFYVWLCVRVYYTFRDTTGALLTGIVWEILPVFILIRYVPAFFSSPTVRATVPANGGSR